MGGLFNKPKKDPDQQALIREQRRKIEEQKAEVAGRKAAKRRGNMGRRSLIQGAETGVPARPNQQPTRTTTG